MKNFVERTEELFGFLEKCTKGDNEYILYRNEIVELNLRLVAHVLKKYRPYTDDQYQAGCMGLILAVNTYKKETGVPFANYACFCIEREIHKMHKQEGKLIENILANNMIYIDSYKAINDEDDISQHDVIPDVLAEEELDRLLEENDIQEFFNQIIIPSIQDIAGRSQVVHRKVDMEFWTNLEIQLFLELAEVDSQKARINFKRMAEALNISIPNVKGKHSRVIARIKERCKERGYDVD